MDSIKNHFKDILPLKGHRYLLLSLYPPNQTLTLFSTLHTGGPSSKLHTLHHTAPPAIASSLLHLHARLSAGINGPSPMDIGFGRCHESTHLPPCCHEKHLQSSWPQHIPPLLPASLPPPFNLYCLWSNSRYVSSLFDVWKNGKCLQMLFIQRWVPAHLLLLWVARDSLIFDGW
jgi:hypothetical protein